MGVAALVGAFAIQSPSRAQFEVELWPGEGRPRFQATATELTIREAPSMLAKVVGQISVSKGQDIAFDETRYRTVEAGRLRVRTPTSITGRVLGAISFLSRESYYKGRFPTRALRCKEGEIVEYLQYRAEGTCFVRVGEQVVDANPCPAQATQAFRVIAKPKTEWWIRMVRDASPAGWLLVEDASVRLVDREF